MNKTKIDWTKNPDGTPGYTWNPITGCLNGCEYCYARKLANTRLRERYLANWNVAPISPSYALKQIKGDHTYIDPFYPRLWEDRIKQMALYGGTGKGIFTCDMSDLFGIGIPTEWTEKVLFAINLNRRNRYYLLTKQPQNLIKFSPFPDNCWVGVSATGNDMATVAIHTLGNVKAIIRFINFEPLLEWNISASALAYTLGLNGITWVIIGAQTKPTVYPKIEWVREIVQACDKAGIPVFFQENLKPLLRNEQGWTPAIYVSARDCDGTEYLRQELPIKLDTIKQAGD